MANATAAHGNEIIGTNESEWKSEDIRSVEMEWFEDLRPKGGKRGDTMKPI